MRTAKKGGMAMNHDLRRKGLIVGVAAVALLVGVSAGFFVAHRGFSDMSMPREEMPMEGAKSMRDRESMPGMSDASSGETVLVPAVARQLIGVRSAPAAQAMLDEEIRTVGTVGYDERSFAQVTLKIPGWVRKVFVDSIGRPVRKGEPLFTIYSPDLLSTQDEYLLALKMRAQLAGSPLDEVKTNADALVASARERL